MSLSKYAFVTVGASASFKSLVDEVVSDAFLSKLKSLGFTVLMVQCGPDFDYFESVRPPYQPGKLYVHGFAYKPDIRAEMKLATAEAGSRSMGLIITHAGSGSILDALDFNTNLIAVPNPTLMDNHQSEIADEMEKQGLLIQGKIGSLVDVVNADTLNAPKKKWPPAPDADSACPGGLWQVIEAVTFSQNGSTSPTDLDEKKES
ncbi:glycosyltransferase family 1 protein [Hypoxylon fuscum]|nr:glycosyltransferase family 1 protein [Hypoxylon fuscum]